MRRPTQGYSRRRSHVHVHTIFRSYTKPSDWELLEQISLHEEVSKTSEPRQVSLVVRVARAGRPADNREAAFDLSAAGETPPRCGPVSISSAAEVSELKVVWTYGPQGRSPWSRGARKQENDSVRGVPAGRPRRSGHMSGHSPRRH
jgi:hypothetical protein